MKPSKMLAVGNFSLNQGACFVGPRKKGHVQAMFSCAAWRKMPRCGLPAGFGEDDLSKTVEFMIRSYCIRYQIIWHIYGLYIYIYILSPGCSQFPLIKKCLDLASPRFHPSGAWTGAALAGISAMAVLGTFFTKQNLAEVSTTCNVTK